MKKLAIAIAIVAGWAGVNSSYAQTVIPPGNAMPAGSVDTTKAGFRVRPYQTDASQGGNLAWTEGQLSGLYGPNTADLSGADASGYYTVDTVVNWNGSPGGSVDNLPGADAFPGAVTGSNYSEEALTYIEFPEAGIYTMGVNSDDGFGVWATGINPKDRLSANAFAVGQYDGTRGSGDTLFQLSISKAGIYPFRLLYLQAGGGANVSWFSVITNSDSTNFVLINDLSTAGALKSYSTAKIAPPYASSFVHSPAGFTFTIQDDLTSLVASSLKVTLNGANLTVATSKAGSVTTVSYAAATLIPPGVTNVVSVSFTDSAQPANNGSASFTFVEPAYSAMPVSAALPASAVDTTQRGFLYRVHQIDSTASGVLAANVAHAEAQLAGLLSDPTTGEKYANTATAGTQPDGSQVIATILNYAFDPAAEEGSFTTATGYPDAAFPGINGTTADNMAGEIITYLDLQPGYYSFAIQATDGFRVTTAANPYDAFGTPLALFDYRAITTANQFGVAVQAAGIYPIRIVWYRMSKLASNKGDASFEFYSINSDGTKVLVNDSTKANAVKAYWKRTASKGTYVKYAGPSAFVSPFVDSSDVGFKTVNIAIEDGTTDKVDPASVSLTVDGKAITATATSSGGLTTLSYTPDGCQVPRIVHSARLVYSDIGGSSHTSQWNFHLLRNYVLPTALYYEDFESTDAGPDPMVPTGWVEENFTGKQTAGNDPAVLNSDFYLGWVVADKAWNIGKDVGLSTVAPQVLNGVAFAEDSNPLLVNHYLRAESDDRQNGPPGQIQYITTKPYDLSGKTGVVIAFNSSYEQNQDNINGLEFTVDGTTWNPVFYWVQGDNGNGGNADVIRDALGNVDVVKTMTTSYGDVARYTDPISNLLVGGYFGFFLKAPITSALAPFIEGRANDDGSESKRFEVYRVPLADNQKSVKFRFLQAGTSSWYWAIDNWGIYSIPSLVIASTTPPTLAISRSAATLTFTWTGGTGSFQLQKRTDLTSGTWQNVGSATSAGTAVDTQSGTQAFYRVVSQ
jgi:hypothetical protein